MDLLEAIRIGEEMNETANLTNEQLDALETLIWASYQYNSRGGKRWEDWMQASINSQFIRGVTVGREQGKAEILKEYAIVPVLDCEVKA